MGSEGLCLRECLRFSARHPRYLLIFVMLYAESLRRWRQMRAARFGYAFLQLFDDLMDGDRKSLETPDEIASAILGEWRTGVFHGGTALSRLGREFYDCLDEDEPKEDAYLLLGLMLEDARRRLERRLSSEADLQEHLRKTFFHSVNLLMHGCGYQVRARDLPAFVEALAWCSVVRDLADDARKGLINVPKEVWGDAPGSADLPSMPAVRDWLLQKRAKGHALLRACELEREQTARLDPRSARLTGVFIRSMSKYCKP